MIQAKMFDGQILQFPDGTDQAVIDKAAQEYVASKKPQPAQQAESAPRPSLGERFSRHVGEGFSDTLAGAAAYGVSQGAEEQQRIRALNNQIKTLEATPSFVGGPNQQRIDELRKQIGELTAEAGKNRANAQAAEASRKSAYESMPPAEGFLENAVAVGGHILGNLASPETLIPVPAIKAAPVAVRAGATLAEKMLARAPETAKAALKAGAATGATNAAVDPAIQGMRGEEYDPTQTAVKAATGAVGGALLRGATGLFVDPTLAPLKYASDADVLANRSERLAKIQAGEDTLANKFGKAAEWLRQQVQDAGVPLKRLQTQSGELKTILDAPISTLANPATRLTPADEFQLLKTASNQANYAVMEGTFHFSPDGQEIIPTGKVGLHGILSPLGEDANRFIEYIAALRADFMEKNRGIPSGFDPQRTQNLLAEYNNNPAFQVARDSYREFTDWLLKFKEEAGIYSSEDVSRIKQWNPDYIPFYRISEEDGLPKALSSVGKDKRIHGSEDISYDLIGNLSMYVHRSIAAANKNRFRQTLYDWIDGLSLTDPDIAARWAVKEPKITQSLNVDEATLRSKLRNMPKIKNDPMLTAIVNQLPIDDMKVFYMKQIGGGNDGTMDIVYRNGKAEVYKIVDPGLMRTLQALSPKQLLVSKMTLEHIFGTRPGPIYNWLNDNVNLGAAKTGFTKIVTMNPGFAFVANPLRDAYNAFVTSKNPVKDVVPLVAQLKSSYEMMTKNPDYQKYLLNGGGYAGIIETEAKSGLRDMYIKSGIDPFKDVINTEKGFWDLYKELTHRVEHVTRFNEYQRLAEKGASPRAAALAARNVSVDFGKEGASELIRNLNATVPFLNTVIQSTVREAEALKVPNAREIAAGADPAKAKRLFAGAAGLTTMAVSAWAYNQMFHKEDYDTNLPDWVKDTHIVFGYKPEWFGMKGDGHSKFFVLPVPYGVGFAFAGMPVRLLESVQQGTVQPVARSIGNYLKNVFNASENPVVATGEAGLRTLGVLDPNDAKTFTGAPVIPKAQQSISPMAQEKPDTATWAVDIGRATGTSPLMDEYMVRQYFSGLTDVASFLYDNMTNRREELGRGTKPEPNIQDMPIIGRLIKDAPAKYNRDDEKLHAAMKQIQTEMNTMGLQKTRFDFSKLYEKLAERNPKYGQLKSVNKSFTDVNNMINEIEKIADIVHRDPAMDPKAKRVQLNQLYYERNMILHEAVTQLEQDKTLNRVMNPTGPGPLLNSLIKGKPYAEGGLVTNDLAYESTGSSLWDWLRGTRKTEEPAPIEAVTDRPFPNEWDTVLAKKSGFGYGTGAENFTKEKLGKVSQAKELPSTSASRTIAKLADKKPTPIEKEGADSLLKAQLAANRSAIAGLGYDPRRTGIVYEKEGDLDLNGAYSQAMDYMMNLVNSPSTYVHESTHRGIAHLRKEGSKDVPKSGEDEEAFVRYIMRTVMGDPEEGPVADEYRKNNKQYNELYKKLEKQAQKLVKERRPGGPR